MRTLPNDRINSASSVSLYFLETECPLLIQNASSLMDTVSKNEGTVGFYGGMNEANTVAFTDMLVDKIQSANSDVLVAVHRDKLVAFVIMSRPYSDNNRHIANLSSVIIDPEYRGTTLLKNGLKMLVNRARDLGVTVFTLDATQGSRAHKVWKLNGFKEYGKLPEYSFVGGIMKPGIYMYQRVDVLAKRYESN